MEPDRIDRSARIWTALAVMKNSCARSPLSFLTEYPCLIDEIRAAVGSRDAKRLERAAHSLKGAVSELRRASRDGRSVQAGENGQDSGNGASRGSAGRACFAVPTASAGAGEHFPGSRPRCYSGFFHPMTSSPVKDIVCAHSPDSDDAFMFYGLATKKIRSRFVNFKHVLEDIESLNRKAMEGVYELTRHLLSRLSLCCR